MITNPQALIITAVETQELLKIVKEYAFDTIAKMKEDVLEREGNKDESSDRS
ncbi:MAG: hypothetical protein IJX97_03365 [Clostridia bacterium]|jgi:hypothetical protein|nr:hypothetical protein [Clostridia bacterium]